MGESPPSPFHPCTSAPLLGTRPSLEYQHAFDLCAVEVHRKGGTVAVFAGSPFYARELLKRLDGCKAMLSPIGEWISSAASAQSVLGPEVAWEHFGGGEDTRDHVAVPVAVWAEPDRESGEQVLKHIHRMLLPGGHLYVIASGWPARLLPEWRRDDDQPSERPAGLWRTIKWLRQGGFTVEALYGFHGPVSILWGYAFRLMERLARGDLADRCLFKMRAEYVVSGRQAMWTPVSVTLARKR